MYLLIFKYNIIYEYFILIKLYVKFLLTLGGRGAGGGKLGGNGGGGQGKGHSLQSHPVAFPNCGMKRSIRHFEDYDFHKMIPILIKTSSSHTNVILIVTTCKSYNWGIMFM